MNVNMLSTVVQALEKIDAAADPAKVLEELLETLGPYGFDHILVTGLPLPQNGPWQREILCDGWPAEWFEHYIACNHFCHDPCAHRSRRAARPFLWSELSRGHMSAMQLRVMDEATEFGLKDGLCVPIHLPLRPPAVVTAAGEHIELVGEDLPIVETLCLQAFRAMRRFQMEAAAEHDRSLTAREREVLTWIGAGKSAEDVACILQISRFTVERHLSNVREKLNVVNTVQAALEAVRRGEISL